MSINCASGVFTLNTSTGNQSVTGLGFQPKAIIFFATTTTSNGLKYDINQSIGFATSSSAESSMNFGAEDNVGITNTQRAFSDTYCFLNYVLDSTSVLYRASFVSMNSDGFTFNIVTAPSSAYRVGYIAFGGTDITNATTGAFDVPSGTGSYSITNVGFQPDFLFLISPSDQNDLDTMIRDLKNMIGFASSSGSANQVSMSFISDHGVLSTASYTLLRSDKFINTLDDSATVQLRAALTSFTSNGFTINRETSYPSRFRYLAIQGGSWYVNNFNAQSSTGNFNITGLGFTPEGLLTLSAGKATETTRSNDLKLNIGVATDSTEQFNTGSVDDDDAGTTNCFDTFDNSSLVNNYDVSGSIHGAIDFVKFFSNGFTLNQTNAETGFQSSIAFFAVGTTVIPSPSGIYFNGASYAVTTQTLTPPTVGSISFWMCPTTLSSGNAYRLMGTSNTFEIRIEEDSGVWKIWNDLGEQTSPYLSSDTAIAPNLWFHVVCTYGTSNAGEIYINGILDASNSNLGGTRTNAAFSIGGTTGLTDYFIGYLEDIRIYDRVISAGEVATIYACKGSDSIVYELLHRYMLNELPENVTSLVTEIIKDTGPSKYDASPEGAATILDDSDQGIGGTGSSSLTFSYTIGSGVNRLLIVGLTIENQDDTMTIDTVTYNSVNVTEIYQAEGSTGGADAYRQYSWLGYLLEDDLPSAGSYNVTIGTSNGPNRRIMCAVASYFNVKQVAPEDSDLYESSSAVSNAYVNVTASQNESLVVGVGGHGATADVSGYDGSTVLEHLNGDSQDGALVHKLGVNSGSYNIGIQWSGSYRASAVGAVFQNASPSLIWSGTRLKYKRTARF